MKKSGFVVEFNVLSAITGEPILKFYDVKTEAEAKELADIYKNHCKATAYDIMPMSDEFEVESETTASGTTWNIVKRVSSK